MKETFYFSHDYNSRDDEKIANMMSVHGMEGYGLYWALIETLCQNNGKMSLDSIKGLGYKLRCDNTLITKLLHDYNLFITDEKEGVFYNKRLLNHLEKREESKQRKSEAGKKGMAKRWEKNNSVITDDNRTITNDNKVKESKVKESKVNNSLSKDKETEVSMGNEDINNMKVLIKETIELNGMIYKPGKYERSRIQNILTGKDFGEVCEKSNMTREKFVINIINLASKLQYSKPINNGADLYSNYADVYNKALKTKNEILQPKRMIG